MYIPHIYQALDLKVGTTIALNREAANHLVRVLRLQLNDPLILFNGRGGEFAATIVAINKHEVSVKIERFVAKEVESPIQLSLGQGISRGEKMDYVIQKAVELGIHQIAPLITTRCGVKLSTERWDKKLQHWRAVAIAACEQCGRNQIPSIIEPMPLTDWLTDVKAELKFICQPGAVTSLKDYQNKPTSIALLIGPESGLDDREFTLAQQYEFKPLSLGSRILRTETAALAAITAIQVHYGDMG